MFFFSLKVEAPSVNGVINIPIAVLKIGEQRVVQSNLEFPEGPITFKLISGSGPVIITGLQAPPDTQAADEAYAMDEMTAEDELGDEEEVISSNISFLRFYLIEKNAGCCFISVARRRRVCRRGTRAGKSTKEAEIEQSFKQ